MKHTNISQLHQDPGLPKALTLESGEPDIETIRKIFTLESSPAKKIRELIWDISNEKIPPTTDVIRRLAEEAQYPKFRYEWTLRADTHHRNLASFNQLIIEWVVNQIEPRLPTPIKIEGFFEVRKKQIGSKLHDRHYPRLERIDLLTAVIIKLDRSNTRYAAMYCWGLMERVEYYSISQPNESSLKNFKNTLLEELRKKNLDALLDLLQVVPPVDQKIAFPEKLPSVVNKNYASSPQNERASSGGGKRNEYFDKAREDFSEISDAQRAYSALLVKAIQSIELQPADLDAAQDFISGAKKVRDQGSKKANELRGSLVDLINTRLGRFNAALNQVAISFSESNKLVENAKNRAEKSDIDSIEEFAARLEALPSFSEFSFAWHSKEEIKNIVTFEDLDAFIDLKDREIRRLSLGVSAEKEFKQKAIENSLNFSWNAFSDSRISAESWQEIAQYHFAKKEIGVFTALAVRSNFEGTAEDLSKLLLEICSSRSGALQALTFLSYLTLGQVEKLAVDFPELESVAAISMFSTFVGSENFSQSFEIWSASPLNRMTGHSSGIAFNDFFYLCYSLFSRSESFLVSRLRQIVDFSMAKYELELQTFSSRSVKDILKFAPIGGAYGKQLAKCQNILFRKVLEAKNDDALELAILNINPNIRQAVVTINSGRVENQKGNYEDRIIESIGGIYAELRCWAEERLLHARARKMGSLNEFEKRLIEIIITICRSELDSFSTLAAWLKSFTKEEPKLVSIWTLSRLSSPAWEAPASVSGPDPLLPRTFNLMLQSIPVSCGMLGTDLLLNHLGLVRPIDLANGYADQGMFEGYQELSKNLSDQIPPDLDREIELRIENHAKYENERLLGLQLDFSEFDNASCDETFLVAKSLLANEKWSELNRVLGNLEAIASKEKVRLNQEREVRELREQILDFGGSYEVGDGVDTLRIERDRLLAKSAKRRAHLIPIERMAALSAIDPDLANIASKTLRHLRKNKELPEEKNAELMAYLFSEVFDPLNEQIRRSKSLIPAYITKINEISRAILLSLQDDGVVLRADDKPLRLIESLSARFGLIVDADLQTLNDLLNDLMSGLGIEVTSLPVALQSTLSSGSPAVVSTKFSHESYFEESSRNIAELLVIPLRYDRPNLTEDEILEHFLRMLRERQDVSIECHAAVIALATRKSDGPVVKGILPTRNSKGVAWDLVAKFLIRLAQTENPNTQDYSIGESLEWLASRPGSARQANDLARIAFGLSDSTRPGAIKWIWEYLSGDPKQAEIRAEILSFLAQCGLERPLSFCLTASPIEFNIRKAEALALAAVNVYRDGNAQIVQTFNELRKSPGSKVFHLFSDRITSLSLAKPSETSSIYFVGDFQILSGQESNYQATFRVTPNTSDWPQCIDVAFPPISPLRNSDGTRRLLLEGPFVAETDVPVILIIEDANATNFSTIVHCQATSISGVRSEFSIQLTVTISGAPPFDPVSNSGIAAAFGGFPSHQMRGEEYVPRVDDEHRIEKALVRSNTVRSIWISSPRRSGKTSMLYRILDSYSHKSQRDIAVAYFTIDTTFSTALEFNSWIWKKLVTSEANKELRAMYTDFSSIGRILPFDADCGTFLCALADKLLDCNVIDFNRAIFLIDEVDRFASMHFEGGQKREAARDIVWQLRNVIGLRRDIGFVFAGSSAAKRIFVTDPESPFFNSISLLDLTPFSTASKSGEELSRMIVEPSSLRGRYYFPHETLEYLIWVCSGIPYYMKLLAGATMAVARQRYLLKSDVNTGLQALLSKKTEIEELDELGGDPGSDELRTMALQVDQDKALTRGVLYAVAEMQSPVSGQRLHRGRILGTESPLVARYQIPPNLINRGLDLAIDLGLLNLSADEYPEIYFSIPLLGESLRIAKGKNWASVDHQLIQIKGL